MAFLLRDIPGPATFDQFGERYPDLDPEATEAFLRLMRVGSDYLEFLDALLSKHDLLHGRWITLILLMREPDRAALPSVLAEKQGVSRATMSGLLEGLEADGLIERVSDEADARRSLAKLTRRGVSRLDKVMPVYYRAVSGLMSAYSNSQRKQLLELLRAAPAPE